jgi:RNA polymerase sigma-70 factor (ECF subfamily)
VTDDARSDAELLTASAHGEDTAFGTLVRRYLRSATLLATQITGSRETAEDVVQDAFTVIYQQASNFDAHRPFSPWCFGIVRRLATNRRIKDYRRLRLFEAWSWLSGRRTVKQDVETTLNAQLDADVARRAIQTLPPMQRTCFELVTVYGLTNEEVAAMYEVSESTVRQHVFRARAALREALGDTQE